MERLNISQLSQSPMRFEGIYRVSNKRSLLARTGKHYQRLIIEDSTGFMTAYAWSLEQVDFDDASHFHLTGRSRYYNGSYVADISSAEPITPDPEQLIATLPYSQCPKPELLAELTFLILEMEHDGLCKLLCHTFGQEHIALPFMQVPASLRYHHNFQGGLLEHSLECARIIRDLSIFSQQNRELGITAALLHDLGKIKTIGANFSRPEIGKAIDHEAISLELCALGLASLDKDYPKLGIDLRHILTCRSIKRWGHEPKNPVAHALQLADRLSSDKQLRHVNNDEQIGEQGASIQYGRAVF